MSAAAVCMDQVTAAGQRLTGEAAVETGRGTEEEEGTDRILVIGTLLPMIGEGINKGTPHLEGMIEDTEVGAVMIAQPLYTETKGGKEKCRERPLESLKDMTYAADKDHRHRRLTTMIDG